MFRRKLSFVALIGLVALMISACQTAPVGSTSPVTIDNLDITQSGTTASVEIDGFLSNACYELAETQVESTDAGFDITVTAVEVAETCTQALVGFEEVIQLDTSDLTAGTYTVMVNDASANLVVE